MANNANELQSDDDDDGDDDDDAPGNGKSMDWYIYFLYCLSYICYVLFAFYCICSCIARVYLIVSNVFQSLSTDDGGAKARTTKHKKRMLLARRKLHTVLYSYEGHVTLYKKLYDQCATLPVFGFNSSGYDLPLIARYLFPVMLKLRWEPRVIKNGSKYKSVEFSLFDRETYKSKERLLKGRIFFMDLCSFLAPGYDLDTFVKAFSSKTQLEKSFFPYEYLDCFERLDERSLPPYNSFVSSLKQGQNTLEIQWNRFMTIVRDLQQRRNDQTLVDSEIEALKMLKWKNKPLTGK